MHTIAPTILDSKTLRRPILHRPVLRLTDEQWSYVTKAQHVAASRKLEVQADGQKLLENIAEAKRRYGEKLKAVQEREDGTESARTRRAAFPQLKEIGRSESYRDVTEGIKDPSWGN
ncbi:hypothetical protein GUITHDRAFT_161699 [Guillardia theta CCMP2712]|uniref:Uncharacterized protein n=1 Tax=Guillardia theta (strain CCMP2712) TaxID=905079 RepID=L1JRA3_GUITC|nr:hypothetical protein GUITHDRAFT_161699 [Guillardia theta CCMP2712]EKX50720.1 hypothetical protein GUITHDRAFT_161699 [Guillardia theta CCMP2712]|eukprot:XP_005837700.1 hypothetical protein GUITHDRAFT_161699 [Guillardia theta CCMP2712]